VRSRACARASRGWAAGSARRGAARSPRPPPRAARRSRARREWAPRRRASSRASPARVPAEGNGDGKSYPVKTARSASAAIGENDHEQRHFGVLAADLSIATRWHCICGEWVGRVSTLRTAIGLFVLGLLGGVVPTGAAGVAYAGTVMMGAAGAL